MDLKEIQLIGFKSFADKTVIRFDEGVTCIVGPNGCGKSNVADAVRWVLGEQSAKSLRGSNMQDVIFGGTVARKPHTFCEVTLVFDNSKRIFAIDTDDVAMTRRLYRNGDSKYLINGQQSRLKNLVTLFHGIGLGKEGYSIIGQGKVEQIMNARPEDRRLIFEEATGLMVYKSKKIETERKIEDAKSNLSIYRQRIDQAEKDLVPLGKQAETQKEYIEYSSQLKVVEANTYIYRYENAESEKDKFKKSISEISDKIIGLNTQIERINRKMETNREKISSADIRLAELQDERLVLSVGNERKDGELKLVRERISTYRTQIQQADDLTEAGKIRMGEINDEIALTKQKSEKDVKRIGEIETETDVLRNAIVSLDRKIEVFERLSDENRLNQLSTADNLSELKKNLGTLAARKEAAKEKIDEVKQAIDKSNQRKDRLTEELLAVKKDVKRLQTATASGTSELEDLLEEAREMQLTVNNFNQDLFNTKGQIASLQEKLEMYVSMKNRYDGYKDSVKRLLSVAKTNPEIGKKIRGAIADIVKTEQKYETAIETAFGGAMQNVVVPTSDDGRDLINYLRRTNGGVVTFLPVQNMKPRPDNREIQRALSEHGALGTAVELVKFDDYYYNVISNLLGNTLICDNINNATAIANKYGNAFKIVTLEGDIVMTSGAMTGGSRSRDAGSLLSHERKIQECKDEILRKRKHIEKLQSAITSSEEAKKEAEEAVEALRIKYQDANNELAALSQRETALNQQIAECEADVDFYQQTLIELKGKLKALEDEEAYSSISEEEIHSRRASAEEELASQKSQCEKFKEERDVKNKQLLDLEVELSALRTAIEQQKETIERLGVEKSELVKKILETEKERDFAARRLQELQEEEKGKELTDEEKQAVAELTEKIEVLSKEKEGINAEQLALEEERTQLQDNLSKNSEKRYKCEIEISKIDTNLENLRVRMEEEYGMDYESCLPLRQDNFNITDGVSLGAALKRKITGLGNVNHNAIEDYDRLKKEYDEMISQRDDVQMGLDDLTTILNDVRNEMLRIFNEGFDQINENFKTTFKELFGGGKAELQLDYVEGEDPLNAGVEIIACPPGKKLTKISLLSGGERALTAIAILFAILKSHPMPFCILDEIEAALDDANVDRFASYLKNFAQDTQFIVITHRKPTMNQADSLFGVTMQEKGVSKIVSVKLADVESKLGAGTVE